MQMDLNPGTFTELDPGLEVVPFDPSQPSGVYADFTKTVLRRIASGLGLSYASLSNDLREVNYSSTKVGLQAEREMWRTLQEWWVVSFVQPLYLCWLEAATLSGALHLERPDWRLYTAVKWVPRGWAWVDPLKEVQATKEELALGLTSRQRILAEQGGDFAALVEELGQENEMAAAAGVMIGGLSSAAAAPAGEADPKNPVDGSTEGGPASGAQSAAYAHG
jgi:lambda family phage portal protein